jgi:hypothetical protein
MKRALVAVLFGFAAIGIVQAGPVRQSRAGPAIVIEGEGSGADLQKNLADSVRSADRIIVTEHANPDDRTIDLGFNEPYHVYASHELTAAERDRLLHAIESADPHATQDPMCLFSPHHAIDVFAGGNQKGRMDICFACGQMRWDASAGLIPDALLRVFGDLVNSLGMKTEQDWRARRRELGYRAIRDKFLIPETPRRRTRSAPDTRVNAHGAVP